MAGKALWEVERDTERALIKAVEKELEARFPQFGDVRVIVYPKTEGED